MKFNSIVKDVQVKKFNPLFSDAKVYVLYTGHNRNNSYFSKQAILDSLDSIYNIPVIGEYLVEKENFGGHGGKLEITDNDIKYIQTTVPYGVVPSDVNVYWENVTEKDGTVNEYLVLDGVKLWTSRYEQLNVLLEQGLLGQSMEIEVENGSFSVIDGKETFNINKFLFSALCMLGIDKGQNPDDHVEPCFESSKIITSYSLDRDNFKREFSQLLDELKFSLEAKGGNKELEKEKQEFEETVEATEIQVEDEQVESTEETEVETTPETSEEFTEEAQTETTEVDVIEETQETTTEEVTEEFEAEVDTTEQVEEVVDETVESEQEANEFEVKYNELSADFEALKVELEELRTFKRKALETELSAKFEGQLTSEELTQVFEQSTLVSIEDIEKELFALVGKKNFSAITQSPTTKIAVQVNKDIKNEVNEPYGGLFEKFLNK